MKSTSLKQELFAKARQLEITTKKAVDDLLSGQYRTQFKGQGMQFSDFREYYPGDDIRHIDWKVTARTQSAHLKKFEEERELTVYFAVDVSASSFIGSQEKTKLEIMAELVALIGFAAARNQNKVGMVLFSDRIEKHYPPQKNKSHVLRLLSELIGAEPAGKKTSISVAVDYLDKVHRHSGVVFLLSDFFDESWDSRIHLLRKKQDLILLRIQNPLDMKWPKMGFWNMRDAETGEPFTVPAGSGAFQVFMKEKTQEHEKDFEQRLKQKGLECMNFSGLEGEIKNLVSFFKKRRSK